MADLRTDITDALIKASAENGSDTPDFILAAYLHRCLDNFNRTIRDRDVFTASKNGPSGLPDATTVGTPSAPTDKPLIEHCSVCGERQRHTRSGIVCKNGHR